MKKIIMVCFLGSSVLFLGCGKSSSNSTPGSPTHDNDGPFPFENETVMTGSYCALWSQDTWKKQHASPPLGLVCLQENGQWQRVGGFSEKPLSTYETDYYGYGTLGKASNGDVLLGYTRTLTSGEPNYVVSQFRSGQGWKIVGDGPLNKDGSKTLPAATQFGGQVFELKGTIYYLWTQTEKGVLSSFIDNEWIHLHFYDSVDSSPRYPHVTLSADGQSAYLYFGEPSPSVWKFDGKIVTPFPIIPIDLKKEWSLQTSLTEWKGQPVIAYSRNNTATVGSWEKATDVTRVAAFDGKKWISLSKGIQDTPGHDGARSVLFTKGNNLYIMYSDYSTERPPKSGHIVGFRYRVKQWNGFWWRRVGGESDVVSLSQRTEYLIENGVVIVSVIQPSPIGGFRQMALRWKDGNFDYLGGQIRSFPNFPNSASYRPGAVIHLN